MLLGQKNCLKVYFIERMKELSGNDLRKFKPSDLISRSIY